ncbi:MAG: class I SAM-dependent RNA methyltransferase [Deltaproteobacteria bacterium]|nr:class I SAM-dependent RNA methyltransferase [Deltaproteobacteria bacterium]
MLWPELHERAHALAKGLTKLPDTALLDTVELAYSRRDGRAAAALHGVGPIAAYRESLEWMSGAGLSGVEITSGRARWRHGNVELHYDHAHAAEFALLFEPAVFTQAFPEMNDKLVERVMQAVRPQQAPRLLELHAGVGNFTVPLARAGARGIAVEHHRRATILCRRNCRAAGVDIEVRDISDHQALDLVAGADVVLLDPPRTGAKLVAAALATSGPSRVVYISCDSATLARDAALLVRGGYALTSLELFDMFPETEHSETLSVFDR